MLRIKSVIDQQHADLAPLTAIVQSGLEQLTAKVDASDQAWQSVVTHAATHVLEKQLQESRPGKVHCSSSKRRLRNRSITSNGARKLKLKQLQQQPQQSGMQ